MRLVKIALCHFLWQRDTEDKNPTCACTHDKHTYKVQWFLTLTVHSFGENANLLCQALPQCCTHSTGRNDGSREWLTTSLLQKLCPSLCYGGRWTSETEMIQNKARNSRICRKFLIINAFLVQLSTTMQIRGGTLQNFCPTSVLVAVQLSRQHIWTKYGHH